MTFVVRPKWHPVTGIICTMLHGHEVQTGPAGKTYFDNRVAWKHLLHVDFQGVLCNAASTRVPLLPLLIRCYIAVNDGEPQVERDIGQLREFLEEHSGPLCDRTVDDAVVLRGSDLTHEADFRRTDVHSGLPVATEFTRSLAKLWRHRHGSRFGYYRNSGWLKRGLRSDHPNASKLNKAGKVESKKVEGSWAGAKRSVFQAVKAIPARAGNSHLPVAVDPRGAGSDAMKKFYKHYDGIKAKNSNEKLTRMAFARKFKTKRSDAANLVPARFGSYAYLEPATGGTYVGNARCLKAELVIVPSLSSLSEVTEATLEEMIYIAALGKCLVTKAVFEKAGRILSAVKKEDVIVMKAACKGTPYNKIYMHRKLQEMRPSIHTALKRVAAQAGSKWTLIKHSDLEVERGGAKEVREGQTPSFFFLNSRR